MATDYFPCYHSYLKKCEKLSDQELGRLFRALMKYSATGEPQELAGRESIAFDFIADDIDRARNAYEEKCRINRENARKAAGSEGSGEDGQKQPPAAADNGQRTPAVGSDGQRTPAVGSDGQRTVAVGSDGQRTVANAPKSKDKSKYKSKSKGDISPLIPPANETGFGEELQSAFAEWLAYKRERREPYKPIGLKNLIAQIQRNAAQYGESAITELIRTCMASGWKGIIFDKLTANPASGTARSEPALVYDYSRSEGSL